MSDVTTAEKTEKTVKVAVPESQAADVAAGLALLQKQRESRAKQREKAKNDPEAKAKSEARAQRQRAKQTLLLQKATAAGLSVSDEEVSAYLANKTA